MPEGAEVKLIGEALARDVSGKTLVSVTALTGRYTKTPPEGLSLIQARLPSRVIGIGVHGKFLYWINENDVFVYNTLGMTGHWTRTQEKHSRVQFSFSDGTSVFFTDPRNFGTLKFVAGRSALVEKLKSLGPDMLSEKVSDSLFSERITKKSDWTIAAALMEQSLVSGVGNYVRAEALYRAQVSPHRAVSTLQPAELSKLNSAIQLVLQEAYKRRGASIKDYRDPDGGDGQYTQFFLVYNQAQDPHGNAVMREDAEDGRTIHWVPAVQK
jgi:formamidopyrimidine-DNA glycosylase